MWECGFRVYKGILEHDFDDPETMKKLRKMILSRLDFLCKNCGKRKQCKRCKCVLLHLGCCLECSCGGTCGNLHNGGGFCEETGEVDGQLCYICFNHPNYGEVAPAELRKSKEKVPSFI